jgi:hypothetical protein
MNDTSTLSLKLFDNGDTTFKAVYFVYVNYFNLENENHIVLVTVSLANV